MNIPLRFYGQNLQDKYIYENFLPFEGGTFLDIGASDGVRFSNTYFFEKERKFTGLCVEPRKSAFKRLVENRNCFCENVAVDSQEDPTAVFLEVKGYGSGLSGLVRHYDPRHFDRINEETKRKDSLGSFIQKVPTVKLETLLDKYNLHDIDLCSIDVEGAELCILQSIDWTKTRIRVLVVENNYSDPKMREYLESVGFEYKTTIANQDEVYVS